MMRQMRENTKWIMLVTALAFFALMVFEWGMDASGRSGVGQGNVGKRQSHPDLLRTMAVGTAQPVRPGAGRIR